MAGRNEDIFGQPLRGVDAGGEPLDQPLGWLPPVAVGDERLMCSYCPWSCPRWYQNQTGPTAPSPGRDGNVRLEAHVSDRHAIEHKRAKARAKAKRAYERKKAARDAP